MFRSNAAFAKDRGPRRVKRVIWCKPDTKGPARGAREAPDSLSSSFSPARFEKFSGRSFSLLAAEGGGSRSRASRAPRAALLETPL